MTGKHNLLKITELDKLSAEVSLEVKQKLMAEDSSLKNFHVSLGPDAVNMSKEEVVEMVLEHNRSIKEQMAAWNAKPEHEKLAVYLNQTLDALDSITKLCQSDAATWSAMSDGERTLKSKIFGIAEMATLTINKTDTFDPRARKRV